MKPSNKVMIEKNKNPMGRVSTANPRAVASVNAKPGPRTGNASQGTKRADLAARRESASGLSDMIQKAYGDRNVADYVDPRLEGISPNNPPRKLKK